MPSLSGADGKSLIFGMDIGGCPANSGSAECAGAGDDSGV